MVVERKLGFFEAVRNGTNLLDAARGKRPWVELTEPLYVYIAHSDNTVKTELNPNPSTTTIVERVIPRNTDSILYEEDFISAGPTHLNKRTQQREVSQDEINNPSQRWHGRIRWREDIPQEKAQPIVATRLAP